jgi:GntR family transcriptional repressor for pyruvate dehydrogenase complex
MEPNTDTLANTLADRIRQRIVGEGLSEGEFFMTEAGVAEQYTVSRNIAREAVSQLRALGVLKSRQAKGLLVSRSSPVELLARSLPFYAQSDQELSQLAQWRYTLEVGAVDLAVAHATDEQVDRLTHHADEYEQIFRNDPSNPRADTVELQFHCLILEMTQNPLIAGMYQVLADYFHAVAMRVPHGGDATETAGWQHRAIAQAFKQRDAEQARALLRQHLHNMCESTPEEKS